MKVNSTCKQCGNDNDLFVTFSKYQICGDCTQINYKEATYQKKGRSRQWQI